MKPYPLSLTKIFLVAVFVSQLSVSCEKSHSDSGLTMERAGTYSGSMSIRTDTFYVDYFGSHHDSWFDSYDTTIKVTYPDSYSINFSNEPYNFPLNTGEFYSVSNGTLLSQWRFYGDTLEYAHYYSSPSGGVTRNFIGLR